MKRYLLISILFLILTQLNGQDPRFSQFNASPLAINPAMTGVYDGTYRVSANYRDQWSSILGSAPFRTMAIGVEYKYNLNKQDFFGLGVSMMRDEVGVAKLAQTKGHIAASFIKQLSGGGVKSVAHHIGLGVQVGGGQNSLDWSQLWFSRQFDPSTESVNTNLPSGEVVRDNSDFYLDINAGILWYAIIGDNAVYAGGSMQHINSPVISFLDDEEEQLFSRYVGQLGGQIQMNNNLDLLPSIIFMNQGPSTESVIGTAVRYDGGDLDEIALRLGAYVRVANKLDTGMLMDALIVAANFEISGINFGLSYDINISSLKLATNSRGAFELSLAYIPPPADRPRRRVITKPTF